MDAGLVILRLVVGLMMAAHGSQKLFGWFGGYGLAAVSGMFDSLGFRPGRIFAAAEAKDKGLVTRVVADDQVAAEARATAQRIAEGAPLVARWHKKFARRLEAGGALTAQELDECFDCFDTEDFRIGYSGFLAKKKPEFVGR